MEDEDGRLFSSIVFSVSPLVFPPPPFFYSSSPTKQLSLLCVPPFIPLVQVSPLFSFSGHFSLNLFFFFLFICFTFSSSSSSSLYHLFSLLVLFSIPPSFCFFLSLHSINVLQKAWEESNIFVIICENNLFFLATLLFFFHLWNQVKQKQKKFKLFHRWKNKQTKKMDHQKKRNNFAAFQSFCKFY